MNDNDPPVQVFLWENGEKTNLGPDFPEVTSNPADINESGQITGEMHTVYVTEEHPFIWEAGEVTDLGYLDDDWDSFATGINDLAQVVGYGRLNYYDRHAFLWSESEMTDLGVLPGYTESRANAISNTGMVLGYCEANWPLPLVAVIWDGEVIHDLNDLIPPGSDVHLDSARAINASGQVLVAGRIGTIAVGVLLTPVDSRPADVNDDGVVDIDDLFSILGAWGPCPDPPADCGTDLNCDGMVNLQDIIEVIENWGEGT